MTTDGGERGTSMGELPPSLRDSWHEVARHLGGYVMVLDHAGRILHVNRTDPPFDVDDVVGAQVQEFVAKEDRRAIEDAIRRVRQAGEVVTLRARGSEAFHTQHWFHSILSPIHADGPESDVVGVVVQSATITDLKGREDELVQVRDRFETFLNNAPVRFFVVDRDGTIQLSRGAAILGGEDADLEGQRVQDLYRDNETIMKELERAMGGRTTSARVPVGDQTIECRFVPLGDDPEHPDEVVGLAYDVTAEIAASDLRHDRSDMVLEQAPVILFALGPEGTIEVSEGRGLERLGLAPGEAVGRSAEEMYADFPEALDSVHRALDGERFRQRIHVAEATFDVRWEPVLDDEGELVRTIGVAIDVTEEVAAERALRAQQLSRPLVQYIFQTLLQKVDVPRPLLKQLGRRLADRATEEAEDTDAALDAFQTMGLGRLTMVQTGPERYEFHGSELLEQQEDAHQPTCIMTLGFLEGIVAWEHRGHRVVGAEYHCRSTGHDHCVFLLEVREAAGPPDLPLGAGETLDDLAARRHE